MNTPAELAIAGGPTRGESALWASAAAVILSAHLAFALAYRALEPEPAAPEAAELSMEVDLAPIPVSMPESVATEELAEETPEDTAEPVEDMTEAVEPEPEMVVEEQIEEPQQEVVDQVQPEEVEPEQEVAEIPLEPEPEIMQQDRVEAVNPDVVLPLPEEVVTPEPKPEEKVVERTEPKPKPKRQEKPKPEKKAEPRQKPKTDAKPAETKRTSSVNSRAMSASKAPNPARWNSQVRAAVARSVGRVRSVRGTVTISFVVSSGGSVSSARVASSSGNPKLDSAAVRAVQSARVPKPPEGLGGSHPFSIPVTFN